jgi:S1-C subfamily serine protease
MKKNHNKSKFIIITMLLILLCFLFFYTYSFYKNVELYSKSYETTTLKSTNDVQTVENVITNSTSIADMIEIASSSVVGISKLTSTGSLAFSSDDVEIGLGTGVIVSSNGYILSNCHVTGEKYGTCYVTLESGKTYTGLVEWSDTSLDLSITKINANDLPSVTLGDSSLLRAGESVFAIGDPIGYEFRRTVTSGIISATNRTILIENSDSKSYMTDLIQTDATINPGNSGGPLLLASGEVIGINTVKISSAEGIGFAVPINIVKPIIEKFATSGKFDEATIGILAYDKSAANYLSSSADFATGIYVADITENSPASNSSLQVGDVITSIDGNILNSMNDLKQYIYSKSPGDEVTLKVSRTLGTSNVKIVLGKK